MSLDRDIIMKSQENQVNSKFMEIALLEAKKAYDKGEVPVGALIVLDGKIISKAHNLREKNQKITSHAEILAIEKASKKLGTWRLENAILYTTLEPCPMCAGAIIQSRIKKVVYGAKDLKTGALDSIIKLLDYPFNHQVDYESGVLEEKSKELLQNFFKELRK